MRRYALGFLALMVGACDSTTGVSAFDPSHAAPRATERDANPSVLTGATFVVNSTVDAVDANPGDGLCATAAGQCTLRAAIMESNALPGNDAITLPGGEYSLSIPGSNEDAGATADLDISGDLAITGQGAAKTVIDGNGDMLGDRVFHVTGAFTVDFSDVTIRGGNAPSEGGGIFSSNGATLTLNRTAVTKNTVVNGNGGGVRSDGTGTLVIVKSTIRGNTAVRGSGGGIFSSYALTVTGSTVTGNSAINGGGIWTFPFSALTVVSSTISANTATSGFGGGISNHGTMTLTNSTISGNTAGYNGGGLSTEIGSAVITNSTITGNSAANTGSGMYFNGANSTTLINTLVANNSTRGNCAGVMTDGGGNLSWPDATCPGMNADPFLGPLARNGGPTNTHALAAGSPAIDAARLGNCPIRDQRGERRSRSPGCDIGAFER